MAVKESTATAWLVPLSGPPLAAIELSEKQVDERGAAARSTAAAISPAATTGIVLGRHENCDIRLPIEAEKVSRLHARFTREAGRWRIADMKSRWGTYINGWRLPAGRDVPLSESDLIRITPWTFSFTTTRPATHRTSVPGQREHRTSLETTDDLAEMQTLVRAVSADRAQPLAEDLLTLLLETAAGIHAAADEKALAVLVLEEACRGTGLPNAALLRPTDAAGHIEVIASRSNRPDFAGRPTFSRSLIAAAANGDVAELSGSAGGNTAQSIIQMNINVAICVPLMLGNSPAAYLYLDARGAAGAAADPRLQQGLRPNAAAFCLALGRMASLALANLKRIDIERRQALIEAELSAAAAAQRWILPRREARIGVFSYLGESRPGQYVGGDFFDVIPLGENKIAVALGDVSGKGIPASVLMTASQGFLHAALLEHGRPDRAVTNLNRFVNPRRPENKFITLWVGVFDAAAGTLSYVDAGHGYGIMLREDGTFEPLAGGEGLPIGVDADSIYQATTVPLPAGGAALIVSDGIIEQPGAGNTPAFEMEGVRRAISLPAPDRVAALFDAVIAHAATDKLSDDATAVMVRWEASTPA